MRKCWKEHKSYNEGTVMRVEVQSNPSWFPLFDWTHHLYYHYINHNLVNTWTIQLCLCFDEGVYINTLENMIATLNEFIIIY